MKYLVFLLLLTGCGMGKSCPDVKIRDYKYADRVKVIDGFYEGNQGVIVSKKFYFMDGRTCTIDYYQVMFDFETKVWLDQRKLFVEGYEE